MYSPLAEVHRADPRWVPWIPILVAVHRTTGSKSTPDHPRAIREQLTSASAFDQLHLTSAPRQCVGAKCAYSYQGLALPGRQVVPHIPSTHEITTPVLPIRGLCFQSRAQSKNGIFWLFDKLGAEMLNSIIRHPQTEYRRDTLKKPVKSTFFDFLCVTLCDTYMCHPR